MSSPEITNCSARSFLESPDFPFQGEFKDWFVANAVWFEDAAHPEAYPQTRQWRKRRPRIDQAFGNAQQFCLKIGEGRYFEGVLLEDQPMARPVLHAWIVMADGRPVDLALGTGQKRRGSKTSVRVSYFGVEIPTEFIAGLTANDGSSQPIAKLYYTAKTDATKVRAEASGEPKSPLRRRRKKQAAVPPGSGSVRASEN